MDVQHATRVTRVTCDPFRSELLLLLHWSTARPIVLRHATPTRDKLDGILINL